MALVPVGRELLASLTPVGVAALTHRRSISAWSSFMFSLAIATGLIFSLGSGAAGRRAIRSRTRCTIRRDRRSAAATALTRDALVVLQIGAAVVLLAATGLMIRTLANLRAIEIGFRPERLLTMRTTLPTPKYADPVERVAFYERVVADVRELPGVERAAFAFSPPFTTQGNTTSFNIEGVAMTPDRINDAMFRSGTTDYLALLGVQLVEGRLIDERDGADGSARRRDQRNDGARLLSESIAARPPDPVQPEHESLLHHRRRRPRRARARLRAVDEACGLPVDCAGARDLGDSRSSRRAHAAATRWTSPSRRAAQS